MDWLKVVHGKQLKPEIPYGPGDDVRVWFRILEQGKERLAHFEGIVVRVRGSGASKTFTVRRMTHGEGVERVFPVAAKTLERVEILRRGKVHRGRIYFLRKTAKRVRLESLGERPQSAAAAQAVVADTAAGAERADAIAAANESASAKPDSE